MKHISLYQLIATAVLVAAATSCHSHKDSDGEENLLAVDVAVPMQDSVVLHKTYPGFLISDADANVVARVNGTITAKLYDSGSYVAQGAPLFRIESTTYQAAVNEAEAQLQTALSNNEYCKRQYEAMSKALESDAVSKMDVVQARSNLEQSEAAIKSARAALTNARTMLGYCTVRAPFAGHVSAANYVVGDYVSGEGAPVTLAHIYDDREVLVVFTVEDSRYLEMTQSQQGKEVDYSHVAVHFGDSVSETFYGPLTYEAPSVTKATGTVELRVTLKNPSGILKNGMYATVDLPYAVEPHALMIKDSAIGTDQLGKYVYAITDSNTVVYTPIKTGDLYNDSLRIVTGGLKPGERYVTEDLMKVRDGMKVKPINR